MLPISVTMLIGHQAHGDTSALKSAILAPSPTSVRAAIHGKSHQMHTDPQLVHCSKCNRIGATAKGNGIPAGWRLELQDQLLCPICWGSYAD